jgi:hypothetical protein
MEREREGAWSESSWFGDMLHEGAWSERARTSRGGRGGGTRRLPGDEGARGTGWRGRGLVQIRWGRARIGGGCCRVRIGT